MRTHLGSKGIKERQLQASKEQHNKQVSVDGFFLFGKGGLYLRMALGLKV